MAESKRWWILPRILPPLFSWRIGTSEDNNNKNTKSDDDDESISSDDDLEEFLEKQRNARLGFNHDDTPFQSSRRSFGVQSSNDSNSLDKKICRSFSKRRSIKSQSKSTSIDVENKIIKIDLEDVTNDDVVPEISFSFLNEKDNRLSLQDQLLTNEVKNEPSTSTDYQRVQSITPNHFQADELQSDTKPEGKERHISKMTIILQPVTDLLEDESMTNSIPVDGFADLHDAYACPNPSIIPFDPPRFSETSLFDDTRSKATSQPMSEFDDTFSITTSGYNAEYAELSCPEYQEIYCENNEDNSMEYVQRRALVKTRNRRRRLKYRNSRSVKTVNSIGKAWKSIRNWWLSEKEKIADAVQKTQETESDQKDDLHVQNEDQSSVIELNDDLTQSPSLSRPASCCLQNNSSRRTPYLPSAMNTFRRSRIMILQGQDGFDELRRYIKQGGDFCKELSTILQERSEAEIQYGKTLSKLSSKLMKISKDAVGSVNQAWNKVAIEMETVSEIHRTFATGLSEEVVKPLRQVLEAQHKIRKSVENTVDKTGKNLSEWRIAESKSKKQSFLNARENEKLQDVMLDVRLNGNNIPTATKLTASSLHIQKLTDKESTKLDGKRKKAEELVKKSDVEYYTYCLRAERARLEWETAVVRGSQCFQALEEERLQQLRTLVLSYWRHSQEIGPKLIQSAMKLKEPIDRCDVTNDIKAIATLKGIDDPVSEQLLPDFYAEHMTLAMNRDRRKKALSKILQLIMQDMERERRGKSGVENLAKAFKETPTFAAQDSQQNVSDKLQHMRYILTYLEAARYKVSSAIAELEGKEKLNHPLADHIHVTRDRQGLQQSILKVPPWVQRKEETVNQVESPDWAHRSNGDGNSIQPDSDFDEFSSQTSSEKDDRDNLAELGKCKVIYQYTPSQSDELHMRPGDIIHIHYRQDDGWWLGELDGKIGIFPATYVTEL